MGKVGVGAGSGDSEGGVGVVIPETSCHCRGEQWQRAWWSVEWLRYQDSRRFHLPNKVNLVAAGFILCKLKEKDH